MRPEMKPEVYAAIHDCAVESSLGKLHFGELLRRLGAAGVESTHADYRDGQTRYYLPGGETTAVLLGHHPPIGEAFDAAALPCVASKPWYAPGTTTSSVGTPAAVRRWA